VKEREEKNYRMRGFESHMQVCMLWNEKKLKIVQVKLVVVLTYLYHLVGKSNWS